LREYELVLVVSPEAGEEGFPVTVDRVHGLIKERGGEVKNVDRWGRRRLAYPVERYTEGYYSITQFTLDPQAVRDIEGSLDLAEDVLRHLVVRMDEPIVIKPELDPDAPIVAPGEKPAEGAAKPPAEASAEKPAEGAEKPSAEASAEKPAEGAAKPPVEASTEAPTEGTDEKPAEAPTEAPAEAPAAESAEATSEAAAEVPAAAPPAEAAAEVPAAAPPAEAAAEVPAAAPAEEPAKAAAAEAPAEEPAEAPDEKPAEPATES